MNLRFLFVGCLLAIGLVGQSLAQSCPGGTDRVLIPGNVVRGNTLCAVRGSDKWQEYHQTGGTLIDYKRGPGHPVDPTEAVGTWSATNGANATLTHAYTGGSSWVWAVCREGGPTGTAFTFVSTTGGTITGATVVAGQVACP
jgi:hypothetical protein